MNPFYTLHSVNSPLLISMPHVGTLIPAELRAHYTERALEVEDTDWFLDRLYSFAADMGASLIVPIYSRYVVDLNRPPENLPMYPGQNNTELCPTRHFTGETIYREGMAPDESEIQRRVATYWRPYHEAVVSHLAAAKARHGHAVLFDAHSIKGTLPWLFDGHLPDLNLGTVSGTSCASALRNSVAALFASQDHYSQVVDERFKGGYITRHYGKPAAGVHTLQLEMAWRTYMEETPPYRWHGSRAAAVSPLLRKLVRAMLDFRPAP